MKSIRDTPLQPSTLNALTAISRISFSVSFGMSAGILRWVDAMPFEPDLEALPIYLSS